MCASVRDHSSIRGYMGNFFRFEGKFILNYVTPGFL